MLSGCTWLVIIAVTIAAAFIDSSYSLWREQRGHERELEVHLAAGRDLKRRLEVAIDEIRQLRRAGR